MPADADDLGGAEVVHKRASLPGERERLLRESEVLQAAARRGVSGVAQLVVPPATDAPEPTLVTAAVQGPSLAAADPLPVAEVAGVAAEVARLLAELHAAGLVHGAVEPGHVVLDGAGGAVLVGLGRGGHVGATVGEGPAAGEAERLDPASDVAGWGALVAHLLDWSATEDEPLVALRRAMGARPGRLGRQRGTGRSTSAAEDQRRVLAALADQAQNPDPAHRPSARSLAAAVEHRIPDARMPGAVAAAPPPPAPAAGLLERLSAHRSPSSAQKAGAPRPHRPDGELGAGTTITAKTDGSPLRRPPEGTSKPSRLRRRSGSVPGRRLQLVVVCSLVALAGVAAASGLPPWRRATGAPAMTRCPPVARPAADADGDGCEETVQRVGDVLQAGRARFALGGAGDGWAVGDWDCDGRRTPALLHDGMLDLFDDWPQPGAELRGRLVATAPGAADIAVVTGPDGCERPALVRPGLADLVVDPRASP